MSMIKFAISQTLNSWIDVIDLAVNTDSYLIMPIDKKIRCIKCGNMQSIKMSNNYISFICGCGCRIYYPPNHKGEIITKFVTKEEYEVGRNGGK